MARPFGSFRYLSVETLERDIEDYFAKCDKTNKPYTLEGLALALSITPQTLCNYSKNEDYFEAIQYARGKCLSYTAERMFDKDGVQGAKFYATNNSERMGGLKYADKQELDMNIAPIQFVDDIGI